MVALHFSLPLGTLNHRNTTEEHIKMIDNIKILMVVVVSVLVGVMIGGTLVILLFGIQKKKNTVKHKVDLSEVSS